jgi:tRNA-Thr(GGU) m(6)t(6)A37 methyltransferase TsaA
LDEIVYKPIGVIRTPFKTPENMPVQPAGGKDVEGVVEVAPEYEDGLADLEGFSHVYLIYHLDRSRGYSLKVVPFMDTVERGLFATRAPRRPNPIGISVVRLRRVEGNRLHVCDLDILDSTPLLDIKPCVRDFDASSDVRIGWLKGKARKARTHRSDDRFKAKDR